MLSVAEKIKALRKAKGINQHKLAEIIYSDVSKVIRVENGEEDYTEIQLQSIVKHFKIEGLPLTKDDCIAFKQRLYLFMDYLKDRNMIEASSIHAEIAGIVKFEPCDPDLPMLFRLFEIVFFLVKNEIATAEKKLLALDDCTDDMTEEQLYHYYSNMGTLKSMQNKYEEGLGYYQKARVLNEQNNEFMAEDGERLYFNIGSCYTFLELPFRAILFLLKARSIYTEDRAKKFGLHLDSMLALNYIKANELDEAGKLLEKCRTQAKCLNNDLFIGYTLRSYGLLCKKLDAWPAAMDYFNQSLKHCEKGSDYYLGALYQLVRCMIGNKEHRKAKSKLAEIKAAFKDNEAYTISFESLYHFSIISNRITQNNAESVEYIETVTIPYLMKTHDYLEAVDYLQLLELHFMKTKKTKKSHQMTKAIRDILARCFVNEERR